MCASLGGGYEGVRVRDRVTVRVVGDIEGVLDRSRLPDRPSSRTCSD